MAKVAYETLSDPDRRAEYDKTLEGATLPASAAGRLATIVVSVVVLAPLAFAGYYFFLRSPAQRPGEKSLSPPELVQAVAPHVGFVQGALASGEVRALGTAIAIGEGQMVTTCRGIAPGMLLTVKTGEFTSRAELARANEELDICTLSVKDAREGIKIRSGVPGPQEKIQAVLVNASGQPQARQVSVARAIKDTKGEAYELKASMPLPNGTLAFDSQARLVGIVVTPHSFGDGMVVALGAARIAQARSAPSEVAKAEPTAAPPGSSKAEPTAPPPPGATTAPPSLPAPAPAPRRGPRGSIVSEGITTLWKEDPRGGLIEVLDKPKTGAVGDPIAYWTLWQGRDVASRPQTHCLVTLDDEVVADYDQVPGIKSPDGYWYCALTRFQVDLDDLPVGDYQFTIFVDGQNVARSTVRIEKKFWTRGKYAIIVVVLGLALLFFVRRKKGP